jgi:hypothetical protein
VSPACTALPDAGLAVAFTVSEGGVAPYDAAAEFATSPPMSAATAARPMTRRPNEVAPFSR